MPSHRIAAQWESYRKNVIPPGAPEVQVTECRRAFLAGAAAFFNEIQNVLSPSTDVTDADVAQLDGLVQELRAMAEQEAV
jgi:hypothetical protein